MIHLHSEATNKSKIDIIRVLHIEDDEDDAAIVQALVSEITATNIELDWISTYKAGLQYLTENAHAVCLLDYNLGEQTGFHLLQEALDRGCRIPVVLFTGTTELSVERKMNQLGVRHYLVKGQTDSTLLEQTIRHAKASGSMEPLP